MEAINNKCLRAKEKYYLTEKEFEVLKLMIMGYNNAEISEKMFISYHTVKVHVSSILRKLNAATRIKAIIKVLSEDAI